MNSGGLCALWPWIQSVGACMLNSPWHLGLLSSVPLSPMSGGGGKRGKYGKTLRWCGSSNVGKGGTGAASPWWYVRGGSPGEVVDEPGRNLVTVSPEVLLVGKNCFENAELMCFKRLLPHSVAEQAFASLSKYSR